MVKPRELINQPSDLINISRERINKPKERNNNPREWINKPREQIIKLMELINKPRESWLQSPDVRVVILTLTFSYKIGTYCILLGQFRRNAMLSIHHLFVPPYM